MTAGQRSVVFRVRTFLIHNVMECRAVSLQQRSFLSVFIMLCVCSVYETPHLPPPASATNGTEMYTSLHRPSTSPHVNSPADTCDDEGYEKPVTPETGIKYSLVM